MAWQNLNRKKLLPLVGGARCSKSILVELWQECCKLRHGGLLRGRTSGGLGLRMLTCREQVWHKRT